MITRQEYMKDSTNLHQAYYAQFVDAYILSLVKSSIGITKIKQSNNKYFNDIPLGLWYRLHGIISTYCRAKYKQVGEYNSLATSVCIAKAAARILKGSCS